MTNVIPRNNVTRSVRWNARNDKTTKNKRYITLSYKRIVVKIGTASLTHPAGGLNFERLDKFARVLSDLKNSGREVILVTSGAVGAGTAALHMDRPDSLSGKQAAAAVGQCRLMHVYDKLFAEYGHTVAQILVTRHDLTDAGRNDPLLETFRTLLSWGVLPIVNENDSVSPDEFQPGQTVSGENDTLSALVAALTGADLLVLLSDYDGFYTADPRTDPGAKRIPRVSAITDEIRAYSGGAGTVKGTGGMTTKLAAAEIALGKGFPMVIAHGKDPEILYDVLRGKDVGTIFN
jgi:glutamate 5-kinase